MELYEVLNKRRSIRAYKPTPVEDDKLRRILDAARLAPSAANRQPISFIVVKDNNIKQKLKDAYLRNGFLQRP